MDHTLFFIKNKCHVWFQKNINIKNTFLLEIYIFLNYLFLYGKIKTS